MNRPGERSAETQGLMEKVRDGDREALNHLFTAQSEISFEPSAFKKRGATKYVLSRKLGPVRQKVILDYRRGTLSITLGGVALQTYEPGTVLVPLAVSIGETRLEDRPLLVVSRRAFRY